MPITNYIWDDLSDNVMMETNESGDVTTAYTNEPGLYGAPISQDRGAADRVHYYHHDGDGSTRQLTDSDQMVTDSAIYSAFGDVVATSGLFTTYPFRYKGAAGYYTDQETGEIYVRARTYNPGIGRWLSADPLDFVDGVNLYSAYFVPGGLDPSGLRLSCKTFALTWAFVGGFSLQITTCKDECGNYVTYFNPRGAIGLEASVGVSSTISGGCVKDILDDNQSAQWHDTSWDITANSPVLVGVTMGLGCDTGGGGIGLGAGVTVGVTFRVQQQYVFCKDTSHGCPCPPPPPLPPSIDIEWARRQCYNTFPIPRRMR